MMEQQHITVTLEETAIQEMPSHLSSALLRHRRDRNEFHLSGRGAPYRPCASRVGC
jgi:hypothetical protein